MEKEKNIINPTLKANIMDSLQYLTELNREIQAFKKQKATEKELINFILRRSAEFGYISDFKHSFKTMEQIKEL